MARVLALILLGLMTGSTALADLPPLGDVQAGSAPDQHARRWKAMDECMAEAIRLNPNHDETSLRRRDGFVDGCLAEHNLPPRAHVMPDPPAQPRQAD